MAHQARGWLVYAPTHASWASFSIKCDAQTAANNGASLAASPPLDNFWPLHHSDLRAVYGRDGSTRYTDTCIAVDPTGPLFAIGSTFHDNETNLYTTFGLKEERFRVSHFK